jgi:glycosyltransferase involved in cell wall biosynthesis
VPDLVSELPSDARLLFVQFGDYLEAAQRFAEGGKETYAAQRYTVEFVAELAKRLERVAVLTFSKDYPPQQLPSGVHCAGVQLYRDGQRNQHLELIRAAARENPTHIVVVGPLIPLLYWAGLTRKRVLPLFADSFHAAGLRERVKARVLAWGLNRKGIEWVSNHNLAASLDLYRIGVDPHKIVPFDWPAEVVPQDFSPKPAPSGKPFRLIYVGSMIETKGVGDAIRAVSVLRGQRREVELSLAGGESEEYQRLVDELGLGSAVHFLGCQSHDRIVPLMNEHDASLVPSWHEYPEGLPMTIYEGLCSRSPVIVSDHPMFGIRMKDGKNCVVFEAASPESLAGAVTRLIDEPGLYARLSKSAETATEDYLCPLKWDRLIATWLNPNRQTRDSLREFSLSIQYPNLLNGT